MIAFPSDPIALRCPVCGLSLQSEGTLSASDHYQTHSGCAHGHVMRFDPPQPAVQSLKRICERPRDGRYGPQWGNR